MYPNFCSIIWFCKYYLVYVVHVSKKVKKVDKSFKNVEVLEFVEKILATLDYRPFQIISHRQIKF